MENVKAEIEVLEERLRQAELGPDPKFFEEALADDALMVAENGQAAFVKTQIVKAHQPGAAPKFTRVEMSDLKIVVHGNAAVVTCKGMYVNPQSSITLKFMRVWLKENDRWQIIAGCISK